MNANRTASLVAAHVRAGVAARSRRVPRAQPPKLIEADYGAVLVGLVQEWREAAQSLIDALPTLFKARTDDTRRAKPQMQRVRDAVTSTVRRTPAVAERTARRVVDQSKRQVAQQTKAALGVEVPVYAPGIDARVTAAIQENTALIQKLGNATADEMEATMARAFAEGWSPEEVQAEITKRFDIAERHARFIARDQTQRLYAQVTRMQHADLGVTVFRWMTEEDERVRRSHRVKHAKLFPYEGSRAPSFLPGDEIGCRCWEEPVFEGVKDRARELAGKGRRRAA